MKGLLKRLINGFLNLLLLALVGLSFYQIALIWQGPRIEGGEAPVVSEIEQPPLAPLPDLIRPRLILLHLEGGQVLGAPWPQTAYQQLWEAASSVLSFAESPEQLLRVRPEEPFLGGPVIDLNFSIAQGLSQWGSLWQAEGLTGSDYPRIDRVLFNLGDPGSIYLQGADGTYRLGDLGFYGRVQLSTAFERAQREFLNIYRPLPPEVAGLQIWPGAAIPEGLEAMPALTLTEPEVQIDQLVQSIFPDQAIVRRVDLSDRRLYTDGRQALTIDRYGNQVYTSQGESGRPDLVTAYQIATNFVARHWGWPEGLLLNRLLVVGEAVSLQFGFVGEQVPLFAETPLLRIDVTGGRVAYLERRGSLPSATNRLGPLVSPEAAIKAVADHYRGETWFDIRRVALAYVPTPGPERIRPVWVVEVPGVRHHHVDARSAILLR